MTLAYLFPGQGSQRPGMLHALPDHPQARATLQEASDILHQDAYGLDEAQALESTIATQVGIYIAGVAAARSLIAESREPDAVAGLSVGAYSAATVSGALEFEDGLRLVRTRAEILRRERNAQWIAQELAADGTRPPGTSSGLLARRSGNPLTTGS